MDGFLNILKRITGLSDNKKATPSLVSGRIVENAGESGPIVPKVPSFSNYDPISSWLGKSKMDKNIQQELWDIHKTNVDKMDEQERSDSYRQLTTSEDYFDRYTNWLMEYDAGLRTLKGTEHSKDANMLPGIEYIPTPFVGSGINNFLEQLRRHSGGSGRGEI